MATFNDVYEKFNTEVTNNNNLYLLNKDYHGLYEDDYCYFTYIDVAKMKIVKDEWTTAFACPAFQCYEKPLLIDAINEGKINAEDVAPVIIDYFCNFEAPKFDVLEGVSLGIPCKVSKGRKFRGNGMLISVYNKPFSDRYGRGYNNYQAEILAEDGSCQTAVYNNVELLCNPQEMINEKFAKIDINEYLRSFSPEEIVKLFFTYNERHSWHGNHDYWAFDHTMLWLKIHCYIYENIFPLGDADVVEKYKDIKVAENEKRLAEKKISLMKWCEDKFAAEGNEKIQFMYHKIAVRNGYEKD